MKNGNNISKSLMTQNEIVKMLPPIMSTVCPEEKRQYIDIKGIF